MQACDKKRKEAITWMSSPEGQKELREALKKADKQAREFREKCRLDAQVLHEPITL